VGSGLSHNNWREERGRVGFVYARTRQRKGKRQGGGKTEGNGVTMAGAGATSENEGKEGRESSRGAWIPKKGFRGKEGLKAEGEDHGGQRRFLIVNTDCPVFGDQNHQLEREGR